MEILDQPVIPHQLNEDNILESNQWTDNFEQQNSSWAITATHSSDDDINMSPEKVKQARVANLVHYSGTATAPAAIADNKNRTIVLPPVTSQRLSINQQTRDKKSRVNKYVIILLSFQLIFFYQYCYYYCYYYYYCCCCCYYYY